jgi:hypothetical protein
MPNITVPEFKFKFLQVTNTISVCSWMGPSSGNSSGAGIVSFIPAGFSNLALRHCDATAYATPATASGQDKMFRLVPALNGDPSAVSIQSVNFPTYVSQPSYSGC